MKRRLNLTIDKEIYTCLKKNHVNISGLVNELLKTYLEEKNIE